MNKIFFVSLVFLFSCKPSISNKEMDGDYHLPFYKDADFTPYWLKPDDNVLQSFHKVSDFSFINQNGDTVTNETFQNKVYVTDFFFTTCPGICPKMTRSFVDLQRQFKSNDKVMLLSHSVTPTRDSVPVLKAFAEEYLVNDSKWHLVTGDQQEIYNMGRHSYFVEESLGLEKDDDEFLHTENFILVDQQRHIRGIYNGLNKNSIKKLEEDIGRLLKEKS